MLSNCDNVHLLVAIRRCIVRHAVSRKLEVFQVQSQRLPLPESDDPVGNAAPHIESIDLFTEEIALQERVAGGVTVSTPLVVLSTVMNPYALRELLRAQLVSTEYVRDHFAEG